MLSESKFREIYRRQQESGLSVKAFCVNEGIADSTFYYWSKKIRRKNSRPDFIPLVVNRAPSSSNLSQSGESPPIQGHNGNDDALLELVYPNGTMLRIRKDLDLTHIRALVGLLD